MNVKSFYRLLEIHDPYEPPETIGVYEDISLITHPDAVIYVGEHLSEEKDYCGNFITKAVYRNIHTNAEEIINLSRSPSGPYIDKIDVHFLK